VCVLVALHIPHVKFVRRIVLPSVACQAVLYFSTSSMIVEIKLLNIKRVFGFSLQSLPETFFHAKKHWAKYDHKLVWIFIEITRYSYRVVMKLEFSRLIFEKYGYLISWKSVHLDLKCSIRTVGPSDRRTDMTKLIVTCCNFSNAPKNRGKSSCV
jgi:hypothetical protein